MKNLNKLIDVAKGLDSFIEYSMPKAKEQSPEFVLTKAILLDIQKDIKTAYDEIMNEIKVMKNSIILELRRMRDVK